MNLAQTESPLTLGNRALRAGDNAAAIGYYLRALQDMPVLSKTVAGNLVMARQKYRATRAARKRLSVAICGWELAHNTATRVYTLGKLYETFAEVEIIGSIFPSYGRDVWEPIRNTTLARHTFVAVDQCRFLEQALHLVAAHPYDIVHLSQPRAPNIIFGILYKLIWGAKVLVDIDDDELALVGADTSISISDYLRAKGKLPSLRDLDGTDWTRIAVGLAKDFDGITVSNPILQERYGGGVIRNARDENRHQYTPEQKRQSRERFGVAQDTNVVLFPWTTGDHKVVLETAQAIAALGRKDILFAVMGDLPDATLELALQAVPGVEYAFIGNQPIDSVPEVVAIGDVCVLVQDASAPGANCDAHLSDALIMRVPVLATEIPAVADAVLANAVLPVTPHNLVQQLARVLDVPDHANHLRSAGDHYFRTELSYSENLRRLRHIVTRAPNQPLSTSAESFALATGDADLATLLRIPRSKSTAPAQFETKFRILLVSYYCPTRAHAGGLRILDIYALIRRKCPNVQIDLLTFHRPSIDWSLDDVNQLFHNVYLSPVEELTPEILLTLRGYPLRYDVIDMQFHQSGHQIDAFRRIGDKLLFTPMESLLKVAFINFRTKFITADKGHLPLSAGPFHQALEEVSFVSKADCTVCVSRTDAALLRAVTSSKRVSWVDTGVSQYEFSEALASDFSHATAGSRRCNVLYIAYFGSETNVHALRWYLDNVHPIIKTQVPGYVLTVVGRGDLSAFTSYRDNSIEFVGEVAAIAPYIKEARVGIAPAVSGAGFRGKVNQYAIYAVPAVASPIAHKGLKYRDGENIFLAETPREFADRCVQLLTDFDLNDRIGQSARGLCLANYSWQSKWPAIRKIYNLAGVDGDKTRATKVTALVPSYNHGRYIHERIESIMNQTYPHIELIVIDDRSTDNSHEVISRLQELYGFQYIRNEINSGTPFAAWERICTLATGDYIWVCESDDVAEPNFLEKALAGFAREPTAVLFYSSSHIIDEDSQIIDHTDSYFHDIWKEKRWDHSFTVDGMDELRQFQLRGQIVPNMSSALVKASAFREAYSPFLKRLRLTGDWLFIGDVMKQGRVIFDHDALSRFRKHEVTSRVRVKSARSQAEFLLTKYRLFCSLGLTEKEFALHMESDIVRFIYEPASWVDVFGALIDVSSPDAIKCLEMLCTSVAGDTNLIANFKDRCNSLMEQ